MKAKRKMTELDKQSRRVDRALTKGLRVNKNDTISMSEEIRKALRDELQRTWEHIAIDALQLDPNNTLSRRDVMDMVGDYVQVRNPKDPNDLGKIWFKLPWTQKEAILKETFKFSRYSI